MEILQETAQLVRQKLGSDFEKLTVERVAVGLFFTGAKLSNGAGGVSYTPVKDIPQAVCGPSSTGRIAEKCLILFYPGKRANLPQADDMVFEHEYEDDDEYEAERHCLTSSSIFIF